MFDLPKNISYLSISRLTFSKRSCKVERNQRKGSMMKMIQEKGYRTERLLVYRRGSLFRAGTSREFFQEPSVRPNIGSNTASFCYILAGTGEYVQKDNGRKYPFHPGTLILKNPVLHYDQHHDRGLYLDKYIVLPQEQYAFFMTHSGCPREMLVREIGIDTPVCRKFDELIDELRFESETRVLLAMMHLSEFAMSLFLPRDTVLTLYRSEMEEAIRLLEKDFREKITLRDLADAASMSQTNFRRIFKEYYGIAPMEYRLRKKLELILITMRSRRLPVKEIAERFGYPDAFSFSRQFKQYSGMSPRAFYRKMEERERQN